MRPMPAPRDSQPAKADLSWTCAGSSTTRSRSRSWAASAASATRRVGASTGWSDPGPGALAGRTALVTGPTSGLGRATADSLASLGARVVLVGRSRERLSDTAAELALRHGDAERFPVVVADMSSLASVREAVAAIEASEPRLDILVDSAGAIYAERTVTEEGLEATLRHHGGGTVRAHLRVAADAGGERRWSRHHGRLGWHVRPGAAARRPAVRSRASSTAPSPTRGRSGLPRP